MYKQSFGQLTKKEGTLTSINPISDYEIMWELNLTNLRKDLQDWLRGGTHDYGFSISH